MLILKDQDFKQNRRRVELAKEIHSLKALLLVTKPEMMNINIIYLLEIIGAMVANSTKAIAIERRN